MSDLHSMCRSLSFLALAFAVCSAYGDSQASARPNITQDETHMVIDLLVENPLLLLFIVSALGYAIGRIKNKESGWASPQCSLLDSLLAH
jgi:hypothetical protein